MFGGGDIPMMDLHEPTRTQSQLKGGGACLGSNFPGKERESVIVVFGEIG